jgi:hypothetical protein
MLRGHIWPSRAFSAQTQAKVILAVGVSKRVLYTDDMNGVVNDLRAGDRLVVAGFRGVGRTQVQIDANISRVHDKGAAVMDAATGRLSTGKYRDTMIDEAVKALANERRGPRKRTKKDRRMPWDQVLTLYLDPRLSNDELEDVVANGFSRMSYDTMRRHFKRPRGAPVGRPSKQRVAATI